MTPEQRAHLLRLVAATPCAFCAEGPECDYGFDAIVAFVNSVLVDAWSGAYQQAWDDCRAGRDINAAVNPYVRGEKP